MESKSTRSWPTVAGSKDEDRDYKSGSPGAKGSYSGEWRAGIISRTNSPAEYKTLPLQRETSSDLVDAEFERLKFNPSVVIPEVAHSQVAKNFVNGFKILSMNMSDAHSGRVIWRSGLWDASSMFDDEIEERIPSEILHCRTVSRELVFSSSEEIKKFRLEQRVYFRGTCIEEWFFSFGYVIAGSRNTWQQTIDAAPPSQMLDARVLSGNIVFETSFYDDKMFLCKNTVRIFYV